jgi:hypothetical protein
LPGGGHAGADKQLQIDFSSTMAASTWVSISPGISASPVQSKTWVSDVHAACKSQDQHQPVDLATTEKRSMSD